MIEINIHNKPIEPIPETWAEMTAPVLKALGEVYFDNSKTDLDKLNAVLVGAGLNLRHHSKVDFDFVGEQLLKHQVYEKMAFMLGVAADKELYEQNQVVKYDIYHSMPQVLEQEKGLLGPADNMGNVCFIEYLVADDLWVKWYEQQASPQPLSNREGLEQPLRMFFGCLWRKRNATMTIDNENYQGDLRIAFNENVVGQYGTHIIDLATMQAAALWWMGIRLELRSQYPHLFGKSEDDESSDDGGGVPILMQSVAESGIFGDLQHTKMSNAHECLAYLNNKIKVAREQKKQLAVSG